jgi:signal transduction histidine kinase
VEPLFAAPGAVALVVPGENGSPDFLLRAVLDEAVLTIRYDGREVVQLFVERSDLGRTGEVFLTDPQGRFLTPSRYGAATPTGASAAEPLQQCRTHAGELIAVDYRGVQTIHGYRPVPAIGGGCIDAHIAYAEALEPAEALRTELITRGVAFAVLGALLSVIASQWISWPVRRLARAARALQAGNFDARVPMTGPSEIRALARAFTAMARELAQLVQREQAARREAEDANESKDRFLATLSHELRTPLHAVQGWARMLSTGSLDSDGVQRAARAIERSAESQRRLIDDLLDVSKIVAGRLRMNRSITSLAGATEAALDAVRPQAEEKGVTLIAEIDDRALYVMGDPQRLQQIVWNLAWNAIKFTPAGGTVSVRLRRAGARAELIVTDTGVGIAPEVLPHVFEWYRQGNVDGQDDTGLGLGLGLVQQLVELHGGTVRADSQGPGTGATFTVLFPVTLPVRAHTAV